MILECNPKTFTQILLLWTGVKSVTCFLMLMDWMSDQCENIFFYFTIN